MDGVDLVFLSSWLNSKWAAVRPVVKVQVKGANQLFLDNSSTYNNRKMGVSQIENVLQIQIDHILDTFSTSISQLPQ